MISRNSLMQYYLMTFQSHLFFLNKTDSIYNMNFKENMFLIILFVCDSQSFSQLILVSTKYELYFFFNLLNVTKYKHLILTYFFVQKKYRSRILQRIDQLSEIVHYCHLHVKIGTKSRNFPEIVLDYELLLFFKKNVS